MLIVGSDKSPLLSLPDSYLFIDDTLDGITVPKRRRVTVLDLSRHSLNPLKGMNDRRARELSNAIYSASPQGENTLTVRNGRRALAKIFKDKPASLDTIEYDTSDAHQEAKGMIDDLLLSDIVKDFLCNPTNFPLDGIVLAKLDRSVLDPFDAYLIATFLISSYKGHVVVPDFGFYGHKGHLSLIYQGRLSAGVNFLDEPKDPDLRQALLRMEKYPSRCLYDDAVRLAKFAGLIPDPTREDNPFNRFVKTAIDPTR